MKHNLPLSKGHSLSFHLAKHNHCDEFIVYLQVRVFAFYLGGSHRVTVFQRSPSIILLLMHEDPMSISFRPSKHGYNGMEMVDDPKVLKLSHDPDEIPKLICGC